LQIVARCPRRAQVFAVLPCFGDLNTVVCDTASPDLALFALAHRTCHRTQRGALK
jgi:hypothetical protein